MKENERGQERGKKTKRVSPGSSQCPESAPSPRVGRFSKSLRDLGNRRLATHAVTQSRAVFVENAVSANAREQCGKQLLSLRRS